MRCTEVSCAAQLPPVLSTDGPKAPDVASLYDQVLESGHDEYRLEIQHRMPRVRTSGDITSVPSLRVVLGLGSASTGRRNSTGCRECTLILFLG